MRSDHRQRVREHLEGALSALRAAPGAPAEPARRANREAAMARLRDYIDAGEFPVNEVSPDPTPVFVDPYGVRCAVAALLEATGEGALVERVARIQPAYHAMSQSHWQPTVSVVAGAYGEGGPAGARFSAAPALRVGVRRVTHGNDHRGASEYSSVALTLEYARSFVVGVGSSNRLGLLLHWEPVGNHSDVQWFLMGGPLATIDEDYAPGGGFGAQLGVGFGFRTRAAPLFAELVTQALGERVLRAGLQLGVAW